MFANIFIYIFFLLTGAEIYIYFNFIRKLTKSLLLRNLWFLPSLLLLGCLFVYFFGNLDDHEKGIFSIIFLILTLPKIIFAIITMLDIPFRIFFKWKVYPFTVIALSISVIIIYIMIYGSTVGKSKFQVKEVTFYSPNLPETFEGFRIVQISDLHLKYWSDTVPIVQMVNIVNGLNPDLIAVTGDLVHIEASETKDFEEILSRLKATFGVFFIMGNHDYGNYRRWNSIMEQAENLIDLKNGIKNMGWITLDNDHVFLSSGKEIIALIGVENDGEGRFKGNGDLPKAMEGTENAKFKILLSHNPTHWKREVLDTDIDLTLSGHTHAMQFSIGNFSFSQFRYKEWGGLYLNENQGLYVNVGIGTVGIPFRFGAYPEITVITLSKNK